MRPRKQGRNLPACLYFKHGSYWLVKKSKWHNLGKDYNEALQEYVRLTAQHSIAGNGMPALIDKVLSVHLKGLSKHTQNQYNHAARQLKKILAEFEPQQLKPKHIAAIKINLAKTPVMCNRILSFLRIVFNYALEWDLIESNPCIGIRRHKEKARTRYLEHDEFNAILAQLSEPMQNLFTLVYLTGQRISDVLNLNQSDISEAGIHFIQRKTGAKVLIGITADITGVLARIQPNAQGWLFYKARSGQPISYETARQAFHKASKAAGIQDATIHDLRAKALTDADSEGKNAQKLGGHISASTTRIYLRGRKAIEASAPQLPPKIPKVLDST